MELEQNKKYQKKLERNREKVDLIGGLFPRDYVSIVASASGTGKTWFMLYLACQLSRGGEICGGLKKETPKKILIFAGETGKKLLDHRVAETLWDWEGENLVIYDAYDMAMDNFNYMISSPEGRKNIFEICAFERPDIIFFDTLISYNEIDESKQAEMAKIYLYLGKIARTLNCAVVCNHHTRKRPSDNPNRKQNQDDVIGSSAGVRLASAVYILSPYYENDISEHTDTIEVKNVKAWDKKLPNFTYKFIDNGGYTDFEINLYVDKDEKYRANYRIRKIIEDIDVNVKLNPQELAKTMRISDTYIRNILEEAYERGVLNKLKMGKKIYYEKRII